MPELSEKFQPAEDRFNHILMDIIKSIADNKIIDSSMQYYRGIETLLVFSRPYYDKRFSSSYYHISQKYNIERKKIGNEETAKEEYYNSVLDLLIDLISRSGFIPVRILDGVIDWEDIEGGMDNNEIQSEDNGSQGPGNSVPA